MPKDIEKTKNNNTETSEKKKDRAGLIQYLKEVKLEMKKMV